MKYKWKPIGIGSVDNLAFQLAKIVRNSNANKFGTRRRYLKAQERFIKHIGKKFKVQNIKNIKDKHLKSYSKFLKEKECTNQYIKTELSAIRFLHNDIPNTRDILKDSRVFNKKLGVSKVDSDATKIYRAWSKKEIKDMKKIAKKLNKNIIIQIIQLQISLGLKLDEAMTLKSYQVKNALKEGKLYIEKRKVGITRSIPLDSESRKTLESLDLSRRYCIVPEEYLKKNEIHKFKKSVQNFIYNNQERLLTTLGLRYTFAQRKYQEFIKSGLSKCESRLKVGSMLGLNPDIISKVL